MTAPEDLYRDAHARLMGGAPDDTMDHADLTVRAPSNIAYGRDGARSLFRSPYTHNSQRPCHDRLKGRWAHHWWDVGFEADD